MFEEYRCKQGDVLDLICFEHYGSEDYTEAVLEANHGLANYTELPFGRVIILPVFASKPTIEAHEQEQLWG